MPEVWTPVVHFDLPGLIVGSGYQRLQENVTNGKADNHEGLDFYRPVEYPDKAKPLWGENQWPTLPGFREKFEIWVRKMKELGLVVMEAYVQIPFYRLMTADCSSFIGWLWVWECRLKNGEASAAKLTIDFG